MRALVTGGSGFVGRHLCAELRARGHAVTVAGRAADGDAAGIDVELDLAFPQSIRDAFEAANPSVVFHLAAQAFVPRATEYPLETYETNVLGTARVIDALRARSASERPRLVFVSSGEVYGARSRAELPLRETATTAPATPYAASKSAGEAVVLASARTYGFSAIVTRAFNQIGPGQNPLFVVPALAGRLARIAAGGDPVLPVGNLESQRDFLDVRDVVRAYADLAEHGADGEIYNVCSGMPTPIVDLLRKLVTIAHVGVEIREDPALVRAVDVPVTYGDNTKLRAATGWEPSYTLMRTLRDVYDDAVKSAAGAHA
jgi:GDP-4-dehydro-6-deoxy-D-mannose reductase